MLVLRRLAVVGAGTVFAEEMFLEQYLRHRSYIGTQLSGAGNGTIEVVGMGGAQRRKLPASLSPGRGEQAVGVDHAANGREGAIQDQVSWCV